MINLQIGKKCDSAFASYLDKNEGLKIDTSSPINALFILSNIKEIVKECFQDKLIVAITIVDEIPFLIFEFGIMNFDAAVYRLDIQSSEENALNLLLIENNNDVIEGMRTIGLDETVMEPFFKQVKKNKFSQEEFIGKVNKIQNKYTTRELLTMSVARQFLKGLDR